MQKELRGPPECRNSKISAWSWELLDSEEAVLCRDIALGVTKSIRAGDDKASDDRGVLVNGLGVLTGDVRLPGRVGE
jgi:hypothetical protein